VRLTLDPSPPNKPPRVSLLAPTDGATLSGAIALQAVAEDPDGRVTKVVFELPDGSLGEDSVPPFATDWDTRQVKDGGYEIRAQATDDQGRVSAKASARVAIRNDPSVPNQPPTVVIVTPKNEAYVAGMVRIEVAAADPDGLVARVVYTLPDSTSLTATVPPFSIRWNSSPIQVWQGDISAVAYDNLGAASPPALVSVTVFNVLP